MEYLDLELCLTAAYNIVEPETLEYSCSSGLCSLILEAIK